MRIDKIENNKVQATLSFDELMFVSNLISVVEEQASQKNSETSKLTAMQHLFASEVIIARDLSRYGHLDEHALKQILLHKRAAGMFDEL